MSDDELHLYEVAISDADGRPVKYLVASWNGPHKAVALATIAHERSRPGRLFRVLVDDLGRAPDEIPGTALVDRFEF